MRAGPRTPRDVIEDLGFGLAQLRVLLLGSGVVFVESSELAAAAAVTMPTAKEFGLADYEKSFLTSIVFTGVLAGNLLGGYVGDTVGRKAPILAAYFGTAALGIAACFAATYAQLVWLRLLGGFCIGVGMAPAQAMQSELTPDRKRMTMMMGKGVIFALGQAYAALACAISDPTLVHLDWRWCLVRCSVPPFVLGLAAAHFLFESPIFLAHVGHHGSARLSFEAMRRWNAFLVPEVQLVSTSYDEADLGVSYVPVTSLKLQLRALFGPRIVRSTLSLLTARFVGDISLYGHAYAEPQVLASTHMTEGPAWQLLLESIYIMMGSLLVIPADCLLSRKAGLIACMIGNCVFMNTFAYTLQAPVKDWKVELLFQVSAFGIKAFSKSGGLFANQLSCEIYPTTAVAMGSSVVVTGGKIGGMLAPMWFFWCQRRTGSPVSFYYGTSLAVFAVAAVGVVTIPRNLREAARSAEDSVWEAAPIVGEKAYIA